MDGHPDEDDDKEYRASVEDVARPRLGQKFGHAKRLLGTWHGIAYCE
jgi:hypothetical protein